MKQNRKMRMMERKDAFRFVLWLKKFGKCATLHDVVVVSNRYGYFNCKNGHGVKPPNLAFDEFADRFKAEVDRIREERNHETT